MEYIKKFTAEIIEKILSKGVRDMPQNPAAQGYSERQIRGFYYIPEKETIELVSEIEDNLSVLFSKTVGLYDVNNLPNDFTYSIDGIKEAPAVYTNFVHNVTIKRFNETIIETENVEKNGTLLVLSNNEYITEIFILDEENSLFVRKYNVSCVDNNCAGDFVCFDFTANEDLREYNENTRKENELERIDNENTRIDSETLREELTSKIPVIESNINNILPNIENLNIDVQNIKDKNIAEVDKENVFLEKVTFKKDVLIEGTTKTQNSETNLIKSKILVVNETGEDLTVIAGIVIRLGNNENYLIGYNTSEGGIVVGKCNYNAETGECGIIETMPGLVALRDNSNLLTNGNIPIWNDEKKRFIDSSSKPSDFLTTTEAEEQFALKDNLPDRVVPLSAENLIGVIENNKQYDTTAIELTTLTLNAPSTIDSRFSSDFAFRTGATMSANSLTTSGIKFKGRDCLADGKFDIQPNTNYYINFMAYGGELVGIVSII